MEGTSVQILVRDNNIEQALKALKRKLQRGGVFHEMKRRADDEKPSEMRARERAEAIRRVRKLARKQAQRGPASRSQTQGVLAATACDPQRPLTDVSASSVRRFGEGILSRSCDMPSHHAMGAEPSSATSRQDFRFGSMSRCQATGSQNRVRRRNVARWYRTDSDTRLT